MNKEKVSDFMWRQLYRIGGLVDLILIPIKIPVLFIIGIVISIKYKMFTFPAMICGFAFGLKIAAKTIITGNDDELSKVLNDYYHPTEIG